MRAGSSRVVTFRISGWLCSDTCGWVTAAAYDVVAFSCGLRNDGVIERKGAIWVRKKLWRN